jgi:hypothetical protein
MTPREQLELAAKALGLDYGWQHIFDDYEGSSSEKYDWNPLTDQADSDMMACKLRLDRQIITSKFVYCIKLVLPGKNIEKGVIHNNADEDVCRAVREARLAVAAQIGRMMK